MRTNIEIDDKLMKQAMKASGLGTKKAVVQEALALLVRMRAQREILKLRGKFQIADDYDPKAMTKDKWAEAERRWQEDQKLEAQRAKPSAASRRRKAA